MKMTVQTLPQDQSFNDSYSSTKPYLISLAPLPDAWGLHTKEGEWVPADNNHPNHQQFEHRQEGSKMSVEIKQETVFQYNTCTWLYIKQTWLVIDIKISPKPSRYIKIIWIDVSL